MNGLARTLLLLGGSDLDAARSGSARGEQIVAFSDVTAGGLSASSLPFSRSVEALGDDPEMPLYRATADWTRAFGLRATDASGETLKSALRYRDTTLWWWAELYLTTTRWL